MPIQIYWEFYHQKLIFFRYKKSNIFHIFHIPAQNIDCGYSLEPPFEVGLRVLTICFLAENKKTNVYLCKPKFYCIKVGFKGVETI